MMNRSVTVIVMTTELSAGCHGSVILIDSVVDLLQCLVEHHDDEACQ